MHTVKNMKAEQFAEILEEIKRGDQDYSNKQVRDAGAPRKCKKAFKGKEPVDPKELLTKLEESLIGQEEHYKYYTQHFLPALLGEIIQSKELKLEAIKKIAGIISDAIKQGGKEEYKYYIETFLPALLREITQSKKLDQEKVREIGRIISEITSKSSDKDHSSSTSSNVIVAESSGSNALERDSLAKGVSGKGTPGTYKILRNLGHNSALTVPPLGQVRTLEASKETSPNPITQSQLNGSFSQSDLSIDCKDLKNEKPSTTVGAVEVLSGASTSKLGNDNGSDSGVSSCEESLESLKENENRVQPEQAVEESPPVSSQCLALGSREKENMDPNSQATQMTGSQAKNPVKFEEKEDRENATPTVQKLPVNEKNGEDIPLKQSNNRNLHVALVAGCALSTIGCIVAAAMTSGLVGAGLLAMAAVFAIAAVAELHSNFLSSKLTSINVSPLVDDKELTACSQR